MGIQFCKPVYTPGPDPEGALWAVTPGPEFQHGSSTGADNSATVDGTHWSTVTYKQKNKKNKKNCKSSKKVKKVKTASKDKTLSNARAPEKHIAKTNQATNHAGLYHYKLHQKQLNKNSNTKNKNKNQKQNNKPKKFKNYSNKDNELLTVQDMKVFTKRLHHMLLLLEIIERRAANCENHLSQIPKSKLKKSSGSSKITTPHHVKKTPKKPAKRTNKMKNKRISSKIAFRHKNKQPIQSQKRTKKLNKNGKNDNSNSIIPTMTYSVPQYIIDYLSYTSIFTEQSTVILELIVSIGIFSHTLHMPTNLSIWHHPHFWGNNTLLLSLSNRSSQPTTIL